jgi:hypothetical protein
VSAKGQKKVILIRQKNYGQAKGGGGRSHNRPPPLNTPLQTTYRLFFIVQWYIHALCSEYDFDDFVYSKKFENHQNLDKTIAKSKSKSLAV